MTVDEAPEAETEGPVAARSRGDDRLRRRPASGRLAGGLILIFLGLWFGLDRLGVDLPSIGDLWPAFPLLGGVAFLLTFVTGRQDDPGVVFPGTAASLVGLFFFLFTLGPFSWDDMAELWPVFPLIGGIAFLATWVAGGLREGGLLWSGLLASAVGLLGLTATYGLFEDWLFPTLDLAWPLALIGVGLYLVVRALTRDRTSS